MTVVHSLLNTSFLFFSKLIVSLPIPSTYVPHVKKVEQLQVWIQKQDKGRLVLCDHLHVRSHANEFMSGTHLSIRGQEMVCSTIMDAIKVASHPEQPKPRQFKSPKVITGVTFAQVYYCLCV